MAGGTGELIRYVLDVVDFDARLRNADAVICGEGRIDAQSAEGKIVSEIAEAATIDALEVAGRVVAAGVVAAQERRSDASDAGEA